jgi:hypothetical protein
MDKFGIAKEGERNDEPLADSVCKVPTCLVITDANETSSNANLKLVYDLFTFVTYTE